MNTLFAKIIKDASLYGRFLNTLSLLEYIGSRKIIKSQSQEHLNEKILSHAAEEIRHAYILKRAALKQSPELCGSYAENSLLCGKEASDYFQTVDQSVSKALTPPNPFLSYLYTTLLIETRAVSLYCTLDKILLEHKLHSPFQKILAEEKHHLDEMTHALQSSAGNKTSLEKLMETEELAFKKLVSAWREAILSEKA